MATISLSLPSDGETIDAADVNVPFNTISAVINGNLDNDNIKSGAAIDGSKLGALTTPLSVLDANGRGGWITGVLAAPTTVTANGNHSYDMVFNSTDYTDELSPGMRLKLTRTVTAPTQCTDLESGSSQYFSKTTPNKLTFTDDFVCSARVKLESYVASGVQTVISRFNATSGWAFFIEATGQVTLSGYNASGANYRRVTSYQSIPLNKWVHIAAQEDMSANTATSTTCYVMIDGVDVPAFVTSSGTNPTALIQAGNLEVGGFNGGSNPFDGKLAQVAVYSAKVTQATIKASMNQTLSGSETSLASAYSFNNAITDLNTTTPNDLTAQGSALATNADTPFTQTQTGVTAGTTNYAEVVSVAFSTNTTLVVRVPDGDTIPSSGGVSAVSYSTQNYPYGWPGISNVLGYAFIQTGVSTTSATAVQVLGLSITINVPAGEKQIRLTGGLPVLTTTGGNIVGVVIYDGVVASGTKVAESSVGVTTASSPTNVFTSTLLSPTTGSKTYNLGFYINGGSTVNTNNTVGNQSFILAELV